MRKKRLKIKPMIKIQKMCQPKRSFPQPLRPLRLVTYTAKMLIVKRQAIDTWVEGLFYQVDSEIDALFTFRVMEEEYWTKTNQY